MCMLARELRRAGVEVGRRHAEEHRRALPGEHAVQQLVRQTLYPCSIRMLFSTETNKLVIVHPDSGDGLDVLELTSLRVEQEARAMDAILVFDEAESLFGSRADSMSSSTDRCVTAHSPQAGLLAARSRKCA